MPVYTQEPKRIITRGTRSIASFISPNESNIDEVTVNSFGEEWGKFNVFAHQDLINAGEKYFDLLSPEVLHKNAVVLDAGCGSGRWSWLIAAKVKSIEAIDPSDAVYAAVEMLAQRTNVRVSQASISNIPFADSSFDLIICLGVLHHMPDTNLALRDLATKLKKGGSILLYFYYNLENRGWLYQFFFKCTDLLRRVISTLPKPLKNFSADVLALIVYAPLVFLSRLVKMAFPKSELYKKLPLSYYVNKSFRIMRNDALDRFGTPLEKRFSKKAIEEMVIQAGFESILFSDHQPYWHCIAKKN